MKAFVLCLMLVLPAFEATAADGVRPSQREARQAGKLYGDAVRGKEIVGMWCSGCHGAGPTLDDRMPSLRSVAATLHRSEGGVRAFLMQPHKPMPPLELSTQQIEDIIAFLRTVDSVSPESP